MSDVDYVARAEEVRAEALGYVTGATVAWQPYTTSKEIVVEKAKSPVFSGHIFKAECILDYPPEEVFFFDNDLNMERPANISNHVKDRKIVREFNSDVHFLLSHTKALGLGIISPREYLDLVLSVNSDEFIANFAVSVTHPNFPPEPTTVRGTNHPTCSICYRIPGNAGATRLVNIIHSDARGSLPVSVVERFVAPILVDEINAIREALKKKFKR